MIKIHNDGKAKHMSYMATLMSDLHEPMGYGSTEIEAIQDLRDQIKDLIQTLGMIDLNEKIDVDWKGDPV